MVPVVAIVGRPNVGKSTLFNCFIKEKAALVSDIPGLTRDRLYGVGNYNDSEFIVIDTAGLGEEEDELSRQMSSQAQIAIDEADIIFFVVDAKSGLTVSDEIISQMLREKSKKTVLVINKIDGINTDVAVLEFSPLGIETQFMIAATFRRGLNKLSEHIVELFPNSKSEDLAEIHGIKVAIVGKPNVGKSTLVNCIFKDERVIVSDIPGTTRDSIYVPLERLGKKYTLIDTAGVRRRNRIDEMSIEKFSVSKTLRAIEDADIVVLMINAKEKISEQDLKLLGFVLETGRSLIIAVNKWDSVSQEEKRWIKAELNRRLVFVRYARWYYVSALHGSGIGDLFNAIDTTYESTMKPLQTSWVNSLLGKAVIAYQPPLVNGRPIKLRYAHVGGYNPLVIIIYGVRISAIPDSYRRYLEHYFRTKLKLIGVTIRIVFKSNDS